MIFLAVDLYGVRPFVKPKRISFKPGFNAILGQNGSGKTMVYQVLSSIFSDTPVENIAFEKDKTTQAAVSFQIKKNQVFRIARDYQKDAWNLSQMDPGTKKFTTIETDKFRICEWIKRETGGLDEHERRLLFMFDRHRLPSYMGGRYKKMISVSDESVVLGEGFNDTSLGKKGAALSSSVQDERLKLEEALKEAEKKLDALTELEDEMLLKQDQAAALRKKITLVAETEQKIEKMQEAEREKFTVFVQEELMRAEQERAYEKGEAELKQALDDLDLKAQSLEARLILTQKNDSKKNWLMIIGGGITGVSFLLPFVVTLVGPARFIFLSGFLGGSVLAGFGYFKGVKKVAAQKKMMSERHALEEKSSNLERQFEKEHAGVLGLMDKTGARSLAELKSLQQNYTSLKEKKSAAEERIKSTLASDTIEGLHEQAEQLDRQVEELKTQLKEHQSISEEVYRLQEKLRETEAEPENSEPTLGALPGLESTLPDVPLSDLTAVMNIGGVSPAERRKRLEHDAAIVFRRFRPNNTEAIRFDAQGALSVGEMPLAHMSDGVADQVVLSVSLSAISQFPEMIFPLMIDDAFSTLDHASQASALRILEIISKKRQVIYFTSQLNASEIGHTFELASGY